jgi:type I restriction enzyme S subunit
MIPDTWNKKPIEACLDRLSLPVMPKLLSKDYKTQGAFPIIDQGQDLIAGWTDDARCVVSEPLPLIVFGDHSRTFKYVDFPFARGADGTQLLKPKSGIIPKYFFYACQSVELPSRGYNRHFSILKQEDIALPPVLEQESIALLLSALEGSLHIQEQQLRLTQELKRAAMRTLFTHGLRGELKNETEFGPVPESWELSSIGGHFSVTSGGTPSRTNEAYWINGSIPWVKTTEVSYGTIHATEELITNAGLENSAAKLLPAGTILMAMYGQGVTRGKVAILGIEAACNQACAAMNPLSYQVKSDFLFYFLSYRYEEIRQMAHGGQQQNLNLDIVRDLPLWFPMNTSYQDEVVNVFQGIDKKIELHRRKRTVLKELFKSLLHKLMIGEIRIVDFDLSLLEDHASKVKGATK